MSADQTSSQICGASSRLHWDVEGTIGTDAVCNRLSHPATEWHEDTRNSELQIRWYDDPNADPRLDKS